MFSIVYVITIYLLSIELVNGDYELLFLDNKTHYHVYIIDQPETRRV